MVRAPRSAILSKYSHHIARLPMNDSAIAAMFSAVQSRPANVEPVTSTDSPSAMMMNSEQRSAMWPPSTFQSLVVERPRPGV